MSPPSLDAVARGDIKISGRRGVNWMGTLSRFLLPLWDMVAGCRERALHSISFLEIASKFRGRGRLV